MRVLYNEEYAGVVSAKVSEIGDIGYDDDITNIKDENGNYDIYEERPIEGLYLHLYYPKENVARNYDQIYKRNNWLKRHGIPKRRKPFIQGVVHEWEYEKILVAMQKNGLPVEKELAETRQRLKRNKVHSGGKQ